MSTRARRAVIVGGSMGGLYAALYLRRRGWHVDVFERATEPLTSRGAGIVTHPHMRAAMSALGIETTVDFGVPIGERVVLDRDGREIARRPYPQIATSWNRLFELLRTALGEGNYHLGRDLVAAEEAAVHVTARFSDGSVHKADLLVGADGFRSTLRGHVSPGASPAYAGYVAWRGMIAERHAAAALTSALFSRFCFALPPGEQFLGYPVAGSNNDLRAGHRSWNIVWYRPADETLDLPTLLTDDAGKCHTLSIPPDRIARDVLAKMRDDAERLLPPQVSAAMRHLDKPLLQPIYDFEAPRMATDRIALIGDAAFVVRPHVGAGVAKAADDAAALAAALDETDDVPAALKCFEARRSAVGRLLVARARRLGSHLKYTFATEAERAEATANAQPTKVMAETAQLDFLAEPHADPKP